MARQGQQDYIETGSQDHEGDVVDQILENCKTAVLQLVIGPVGNIVRLESRLSFSLADNFICHPEIRVKFKQQ